MPWRKPVKFRCLREVEFLIFEAYALAFAALGGIPEDLDRAGMSLHEELATTYDPAQVESVTIATPDINSLVLPLPWRMKASLTPFRVLM